MGLLTYHWSWCSLLGQEELLQIVPDMVHLLSLLLLSLTVQRVIHVWGVLAEQLLMHVEVLSSGSDEDVNDGLVQRSTRMLVGEGS